MRCLIYLTRQGSPPESSDPRLEIFFKYTGQLIKCYRCGSTEHVVKNCPKQCSRFSQICAEDRIFPAPPNPTTSQATQDSQMETTGGENSADQISEDIPPAENCADDSSPMRSFASVTASTPDLSPALALRDLFNSQQSRKRPPPRRPEKHINQKRNNVPSIATNSRHPPPFADFSEH